jgi:cell division protein FtsB
MARRQLAMDGKVTRLEARTRAIGVLNRVVFAACCLAGGFVVVAAALPEKRALEAQEARLLDARAREAVVLAEKDDRVAEYRALKDDPAYLELQARDRLDVCRAGERVLRVKRGD